MGGSVREGRHAPDGLINAIQSYRLRFEAGKQSLATIDVSFSVDFASETPMDDGIFSLFRGANLPVNAWPFLREFVATTVGRMGWLPVTLPALKIGSQTARASKSVKPRRPRTKTSAPDE